MKSTVSVIIFLLLHTIAFAQSKSEKAILQVLDKQAAGWNKGDLDEYMQGYWNDDSLLFIGKNGPTYSYKATLERYKKSYSDTAKMGKLNFSHIRFNKLSRRQYFVSGRWELKRSIGDLSGYFTLIFKKIKQNWVIIADHSS